MLLSRCACNVKSIALLIICYLHTYFPVTIMLFFHQIVIHVHGNLIR